jgi:plastocyanin
MVGAALWLGMSGTGSPASAQIIKPAPVVVTLKNLAFKPKKLEIAAGTQVDFTWKEKVSHNVVFSKLDKSKNLSTGVWSKMFLVKGFFKYKCTIHPGMKGEITVR